MLSRKVKRVPYQVFFDPSTSPGEAEHKIVKCMRCLPDDSRVLVISADSDFYSLCAVDALRLNITIYNPRHKYAHSFNLEDKLQRLLLRTQSISESTIHDYLALTSLLGNDFNKPLVGFTEIGRETIFKVYRQCVSQRRTPLATESGIDFNNLAYFFRILLNCLNPDDADVGFAGLLFDCLERRVEVDFLEAASQKHGGQLAMDVEAFLDEFSFGELDVQHIFDRFHEEIGKHFGEDFDFDDFCTNYLASLQFNYRLQISGETRGNFSYDYSSAPLLPRLVQFMEQNMDMRKIEEVLQQGSPNTTLTRLVFGNTKDLIQYYFSNEDEFDQIFDSIVNGKLKGYYSEEAQTLVHHLGEGIPFSGWKMCNQESLSESDMLEIENEVEALLSAESRKEFCSRRLSHRVAKFARGQARQKLKAVDVHRILKKIRPTPIKATLKFWNHKKDWGKIEIVDGSGGLITRNVHKRFLHPTFTETWKLGEGAEIEFFVLKEGSVRVVKFSTDNVVQKRRRIPPLHRGRRGHYISSHKSPPRNNSQSVFWRERLFEMGFQDFVIPFEAHEWDDPKLWKHMTASDFEKMGINKRGRVAKFRRFLNLNYLEETECVTDFAWIVEGIPDFMSHHGEEEEEAEEGMLMQAFELTSAPLNFLFEWTCPDCELGHKYESYYLLTFFVALMWVSLFSFVLSSIVERWVTLSGVPMIFFGLILVSLGAEIPDTIESVTVARKGYGSMAVSNCQGTQVINICLGLGAPWLVTTLGGQAIQLNHSLITPACFQLALVAVNISLLLGSALCLGLPKAILDRKKSGILIAAYFTCIGGFGYYLHTEGEL